MIDTNGKTLVTSPLSYITSNPLTGSFATSAVDLDADGEYLGALQRDGLLRTGQLQQRCAELRSPLGRHASTGHGAGFGYPIYSNVIGATVQGITGSVRCW